MTMKSSSKMEVHSNTGFHQKKKKRKKEKSQISNLTYHLKELEKEEQTKPRVSLSPKEEQTEPEGRR